MEGDQPGTEDQQGETEKCLQPEPLSESCEDMVEPPDGGFGWVIVAVAFLTGVVVDGIIFSFGILFPEILREFGEGPSKTAWVGSVLAGTYLLVGPISSALANRFGCRPVAIAGSILGTVAFICCFFANSVIFLIVMYGAVGGLGFGLIYLPPIVTTTYYFEKKRAFATGIAVCGSGVGCFILSPVSQRLIEEYGWRGNILIQAGVVLNCAAICGFLRPLKPKKAKRKKSIQNVEEPPPDPKRRSFRLAKKPKSKPLLQRIKEARDATMWDSDSSLQSDNEDKGVPMSVINNTHQTPQDNTSVGLSNSMPLNKGGGDAPNGDTNENYLNRKNRKEVSNGGTIIGDQIVQQDKDTDHTVKRRTDVKAVSTSQPQLGMAFHRNSDYRRLSAPRETSLTNKELPVHVKRPWYFDLTTGSPQRSVLPKPTAENLARPFYRKDIFFSGSLQRIPEYASQPDVREYRRRVTIQPEQDRVDGSVVGEENHMKEAFKAMLDLSLLQNPVFCVCCLSGFLTFLGFFIPFVYFSDFVQTTGTSKENAAFLLSIIGMSNTIGRVICGYITDRPWAKALHINIAALILAGGTTALVPFCTNYPAQIIYAAAFGFTIACYVSLRSILLVDLLGLEKLTNSFGLSMVFQGSASMFGSPLAGFLYSSTGTYSSSFYTAGAVLASSGIVLVTLPWLSRRERCKELAKLQKKGLLPKHNDTTQQDTN